MTTSSFADFAATAQDRADNAANVHHYTEILCEALVQNFIEYNTHSMKRSALTAKTKSEAEAKAKGVEGISGMKKADLVAAVSK